MAVADAGGLDAVYRDPRVGAEVKRALYAQRCAWQELEAVAQAAGVTVPAVAQRVASRAYGQLGGTLPERLEGRAAIIGEEPIIGAPPPAELAVTAIKGVRRRMRAHADPRGAFNMELIPGLRPFHVVPGLLKGRGAFEIWAGVGDATRALGLRVLASADAGTPRDRWTLLAELRCREHDYDVVHHSVPAGVVPDGAVYLRVEPLYNVAHALVSKGIVQDFAVVWIAVSP